MAVDSVDFFMSKNPAMIGRVFKKCAGDEVKILVFKMDRWSNTCHLSITQELVGALKKLSKGKLGERTEMQLKALTLIRTELGNVFATRGESYNVPLVRVSDLGGDEKLAQAQYRTVIKTFTDILAWNKKAVRGSACNVKFPDDPDLRITNGPNYSLIVYPNDQLGPALFSYSFLPNGGTICIKLAGGHYSLFLGKKEVGDGGIVDVLIAALNAVIAQPDVYQVIKLSKENPMHVLVTHPGLPLKPEPVKSKKKTAVVIPPVLSLVQNKYISSAGKICFIGHKDTLLDLVSKLTKAKELIKEHLHTEQE